MDSSALSAGAHLDRSASVGDGAGDEFAGHQDGIVQAGGHPGASGRGEERPCFADLVRGPGEGPNLGAIWLLGHTATAPARHHCFRLPQLWRWEPPGRGAEEAPDSVRKVAMGTPWPCHDSYLYRISGSGVQSERLVGPTGSVAHMNLGITELLIVLVILVVLFGAVRLSNLARSLGQSRNEFKRGLSDEPEPDDLVRPPD